MPCSRRANEANGSEANDLGLGLGLDGGDALMVMIEQLVGTLLSIAPLKLAESWDNVGLLIGDRRQDVQRVMTCLTITRSVVEEALEENVDLIITHHPLPFKPLQRLTADSVSGELILKLVRGNVAVYSAHTAFDSAQSGINATWAQLLELSNVRPLNPAPEGFDEALGSGRFGDLRTPISLSEFAACVTSQVRTRWCQMTGEPQLPVRRIGIACGSGEALSIRQNVPVVTVWSQEKRLFIPVWKPKRWASI